MDGYDLISEVQYQSPDQPFSLSRLKPVSRIKFMAQAWGQMTFIAKPL